jgi:hypothetical protein
MWTSVLRGETRMKLGDITPGTEKVTIAANGDFSGGESGWTKVAGDMVVSAAPEGASVPAGTGGLAIARIGGNEATGQYRREVVLEGDTDYVLSARMWETGDANHHVDVVVVDLNDAGLGTSEGLWEGQLTLYPDMADGEKGYFVYSRFRTPAGSQTVTVRLFYTGFYEADDNWPMGAVAAMWDNIAITRGDVFAAPLPYDPTAPKGLEGDLDGDGDVDAEDLRIFGNDWPCRGCETVADINNDMAVDEEDFGRLCANWKVDKVVDAEGLAGKIMCGYQGWFDCPDDGSERGWVHWGRSGQFAPGYCTVDWWPDMSEYGEDEKFATGFQNADGSTAYVFSSHNRKTVLRHFEWMADYGIDGVFVQRFAVETRGTQSRAHCDTVLTHCREGAAMYGRVYAVMYDLSGLGEGGMETVIDDWKHLVDDMKIARDAEDTRYIQHRGRPLVAVWGIGFNDGRAYTLAECEALVDFLHDDPVYGGMSVMVGVPSYWRTLDRDCVTDVKVHNIIRKAEVVSPWSVGRFGSKYESELTSYAANVWVLDNAWCKARGVDYLPVVFPGFSWFNLQGKQWDQIPRRGGSFLWRQYYKAVVDAGATMVYQAMFDEVDEGTAIFKCTPRPPVAVENPFLPTGNALHPPYDMSDSELPSDQYLWLVGQAGRMLRGERAPTVNMPVRSGQ